jgi:octaprenyl-diphosphate synthase
MDLSAIRAPVSEDIQAVDGIILKRLQSNVVLINQIGHYIVSSGGKRLRPLLVLLAARACGYQGVAHRDMAAIVEFIHTATLLHDDVVDGSELRRNRETANAVWGNEASVLVGDFLYSRAFEMMVDVGIMRVMDVLSHATNRIAEGEVLQLLNANDPDTDEARYMEVIERKTATLFEAGTRLGAVLAETPRDMEDAIASFGMHLGVAFQLVDDALDYESDSDTIGKHIGDDLEEGNRHCRSSAPCKSEPKPNATACAPPLRPAVASTSAMSSKRLYPAVRLTILSRLLAPTQKQPNRRFWCFPTARRGVPWKRQQTSPLRERTDQAQIIRR